MNKLDIIERLFNDKLITKEEMYVLLDNKEIVKIELYDDGSLPLAYNINTTTITI
jgi:hypothetical protein